MAENEDLVVITCVFSVSCGYLPCFGRGGPGTGCKQPVAQEGKALVASRAPYRFGTGRGVVRWREARHVPRAVRRKQRVAQTEENTQWHKMKIVIESMARFWYVTRFSIR